MFPKKTRSPLRKKFICNFTNRWKCKIAHTFFFLYVYKNFGEHGELGNKCPKMASGREKSCSPFWKFWGTRKRKTGNILRKMN